MSFWGDIFGRRSVKLTDTAGWFLDGQSDAGIQVTPNATLQLSTAWRCIRLRSRVKGSLPMMVHERLPDGQSRPAKDHWLYGLVHDSPNADQTPAEFWGGMNACVDLDGNAYAEKVFSGPRVVALQPLRPDLTEPYRTANGVRRFRTSDPKASKKDLSEDEIFHLRGFTLGGDKGLSAVSYGRHTLGLAMASNRTAGKTFAKGLQVSGFVKMAAGTKVTPDQRDQLVDLFDRFSGSNRAGKVMPLDPGMEFVPLNMSPADAELLSSRKFDVEEICRWFDTPPILIGHAADGQTMWGTGVGQIMLGWLILDLNPELTNVEQAVMKQLLSPADRQRFYAEYNREALLEADLKSKIEFLAQAGQNGLMSRNEGRGKLNLPPKSGGDDLTVQSNLMSLERLADAPPAATAAKHALQAWLSDEGASA